MTGQSTRPTWATVLALLLVPLLVAGGFLWGTWNANPRLRTVQAAVVNLDEMVEINGQPMPLGRQLTAELVNSDREQNLAWVLADEKSARSGLADGTYAAVVTIPKEFSAAATSFSGAPEKAVQATISVDTSPVTGISETALGQHIAHAASTALNRFLTGEYLKNIYLGFNQMGEQFIELRDGTRQLADGAAQLADGTGGAADGARKLADGLALAAAGGTELRAGADKLADGGAKLASGTHQLADGTATWADGAQQWASGSRKFTAGLETYAKGVRQYTDGVKQYVGVVNPLVAKIRDLVNDMPDPGDLVEIIDPIIEELDEWGVRYDPQVQEFVKQLHAFLDEIETLVKSGVEVDKALDAYLDKLAKPIPCPDDLKATPGACEAFERGVLQAREQAKKQLQQLRQQVDRLGLEAEDVLDAIAFLRKAADELADASKKLAESAPEIQKKWAELKKMLPGGKLTKDDILSLLNQFVDGGDQLISGGDKLADGADSLVAGSKQLTEGADGLAGGARSISKGTRELATGADALADGQKKFAAGVAQYTNGIGEAAAGARKLADGLGQLNDGTRQLADGTGELADGVAEGADQIPHYTDDQRDNLAKVVASPVATEGLAELVLPRVAWASLLLVMALWIGALAAWSVFRPSDQRNLLSSAANRTLLWRTYAPALAVVGVQGLALAGIGAGVLGLGLMPALGVTLVALVAAAAFVAVNHALAAWFGARGRMVSLVFLIITVVSAIAYSAPGPLNALKVLSPLSPALDATRMTMTGHAATLPMVVLVAWGLAAVGASLAAVVRSRSVPLAALT